MKALITSILLLFSVLSYSQVHEPVKWQTSVTRPSPDTALITFKANIEKGWHIYSQTQNIKNGPVATTFSFNPNRSYKSIGGTQEDKPFTKPEPAYDNMPVSYFEKEVLFVQKIGILEKNSFTINAEVTFMVCNDEMCLPPETKEFTISVKASPELAQINTAAQVTVPG